MGRIGPRAGCPHAPLEMYAPGWSWDETARNLPTLAERSGVPTAVLDALAQRLLQRIQPVPEAALAPYARQALDRCEGAGAKDAPYVACCLAVEATMWSHDRLASESGVAVVQTADLLARFG